MGVVNCEFCGRKMHRNGRTSAGKTRWRCRHCHASRVQVIDNKAKQLNEFLDWLLGRRIMREMPGGGRTFRRRTSWCWNLWPISPFIDETLPVIYIDGIYLSRKAVVLIASSDTRVLGWYLARSESSAAYMGLMKKIAAPFMVVSDGGAGFAKALRQVLPATRHQRCLLHAANQVRRYTTRNPLTAAGKDLLVLAGLLTQVRTIEQRDQWIFWYQNWRDSYRLYLSEMSRQPDGRRVFTHQRLRKARAGLDRLLRDRTLFAFLDAGVEGMPAFNNRAESVNSCLRRMLRQHIGLRVDRQVKAIMWWCFMHSGQDLTAADILRLFPDGDEVLRFYQHPGNQGGQLPGAPEYGQVVMWHELHTSDPYRLDWD